ncbi:OmpP1/FadL family transporter [Acidimangrovimonas sediminis]|uniref:OmpP1/FadL family transporter n=1 Tax=Acidimangrovimonas sediminis TaxID=2056283 RepID=UPI000C7FA963|nr:outer membrane protein transport protein [Acidimangrovimonas sediminis]
MTVKRTHLLRAGLGAAAAALLSVPAHATEGYFALGPDAASRGTAGAGVAAPGFNAMSSAVNPAAVAGMGRQFSLGIEAFSPHRGFTATGTGVISQGRVDSGHKVFPVPNFGYTMPLANGGTLNIAAYGNGGMNTSYPAMTRVNPCPPGAPSSTGVFCDGKAGVDLNQLFLSITYAKETGGVRWGIAPTLVAQWFKAYGLRLFSPYSNDPANLSNNGYDYSYGVGLRAGIQADLTPELSVGLSGQTKMRMSKFKDYAGLFADGGSFDIPAQITLGMAYKVAPRWTVLADIQRIWYSGVDSVANPFPANTSPMPLGAPGNSGFGWDDVTVYKIGAVWRQSDRMTWRFGYAHSTNPVKSSQVTLNIVAPGVVTDHFTVGGSYQMSPRDTLDFALVYVPKNSVSGAVPASLGGGDVTIDMHQVSASVGWTRRF